MWPLLFLRFNFSNWTKGVISCLPMCILPDPWPDPWPECILPPLKGYSTWKSSAKFKSCKMTNSVVFTGPPDRMSHRKWRSTKQQPSRARAGYQISCCLLSLHVLCDILSGGPVVEMCVHKSTPKCSYKNSSIKKFMADPVFLSHPLSNAAVVAP